MESAVLMRADYSAVSGAEVEVNAAEQPALVACSGARRHEPSGGGQDRRHGQARPCATGFIASTRPGRMVFATPGRVAPEGPSGTHRRPILPVLARHRHGRVLP
jgi:hypothetical protein